MLSCTYLYAVCDQLENPGNGSVSITRRTIIKLTATYECNDGFKRIGQELRFCFATNLTWTGNAPTCEGIYKNYQLIRLLVLLLCSGVNVVDCGPPNNIILNGVVSFEKTTFNSTANYTCNFGYKLLGNARRVCRDDGVWVPNPPRCERKQLHSM